MMFRRLAWHILGRHTVLLTTRLEDCWPKFVRHAPDGRPYVWVYGTMTWLLPGGKVRGPCYVMRWEPFTPFDAAALKARAQG